MVLTSDNEDYDNLSEVVDVEVTSCRLSSEREGLQLDADTHAEAVALVMLDAVADAVQSLEQPVEPL